MFKRDVSYVYDGDTFTGRYRTAVHDNVPSVAVQFDGRSISARLSGLSEEVVARTLLGELVREKLTENRKSRSMGSSASMGKRERTP